MHIAVTGSQGLIGTALVEALTGAGHRVTRLVRRPPGAGEVRWDPAGGEIDAAALGGTDAFIHLAGVGIGDHRWTDEHKRAVIDSRVQGTTLLSRTIASLSPRPAVLVSASAIGYYGDRGDEVLSEDSGAGTGFLAEVCQQWERATAPAEDAGERVVHTRTRLVMSSAGGALKQMLLPFRLGAGGRIGSGKQWWSWISIDDEVGAIQHVIGDDGVRGPVNLVAPSPVRNAEFTKTLGLVLGRPTLLPTPTFALKAMFGGDAVEEMFLGGQRVAPAGLEASGYSFRHPELEAALRHVLGR